MSAHCASCGAAIFWAKTPGGNRAPFDLAPTQDGAFVARKAREGFGEYQLHVAPFDEAAHEGRRRYGSHFATCPNAAKHRVKKPAYEQHSLF